VQLCNDIQIIKHRLLKVEAAAATAPPAKDKLLQQMALLKAERKQRAVKQSLEALQQGRQAD
jgi:negative regulator of replication initiation